MTLETFEPDEGAVGLESVERLTRDIREAARTLTREEARYLVGVYYSTQEQRIRIRAQEREAAKADTPNALLRYMGDQYGVLEHNVKRALQAFAEGHEVGRWSLSIKGIGPVIAAGLIAHIDMEHGGPIDPMTGVRGRVNTVGSIWRFAGLDPTVTWEKGKKRPWNAELKVIAWKAGESFVKVSGSEDAAYGQVYKHRKVLEMERNAEHAFADQARESLTKRTYRDGTLARAAYEEDMLPQARIHTRATRYAVKLFLSHWHHVAYESLFGEPPPKPYVITHLGHADYIAPPNWPMPAE